MKNENELKEIVRQKYGAIANQTKLQNETSCCGASGCCNEVDYTVFSEDYTQLSGYNSDADLGLGCGIPTQFVDIKKGDTVIDLGSGAGNDCFVARALVGESGKVIGIDMTIAMLEKAKQNTEKLGFENVTFVQGDIENMPIENETADVVISNCVLNLVPNKLNVFKEIFRVLKKGGQFCISDVVIKGELPEKLQQDAEMYAGCVSGASQMKDYIDFIKQTGFSNIFIKKQKEVVIPKEIMLNYLSENELSEFQKAGTGIFSITVSAQKV